MLTVGIDLSSEPKRTAACAIEWRNGGAAIVEVLPPKPRQPVDDESLLALICRADRAGIDAPFGWPVPFVRAVYGWRRGHRWPGADREPLRYRATDWQAQGRPRMPLSVSSERLGATAMRCAHLLSELAARGEVVDRVGVGGRVVEVYPAAALHHWGLPAEGYKRDEGRRVREEIVRKLTR